MIDSSIAGTLLTYGPLGIFSVLFLIGWIVPKPFLSKLEKENDKLRASLEAERERAGVAVLAASTATQVIASLREVIADLRSSERHHAGELP